MKTAKEIGLFGTAINHANLHAALINKFIENNAKVHCFLQQEAHREAILAASRADPSVIRFYVRKKNENVLSQSYRHRKTIDKLDAVIFDELWESEIKILPTLMFFCRRPRKYLIVHNASYWFNMPLSCQSGKFCEEIAKKSVVRQMNALIVISPNIRKYIKELCGYKKSVLMLPFEFLENQSILEKTSPNGITFVIPGVIENKRKNYNMVLDVFDELWERHGLNASLKLLGRKCSGNDSEKIIQRCREINKRFGREGIRYWETRISDSLFENELISSDVILTNIQQYYVTDTHQEIYGTTKESGNTNLMIKYAKPNIVPSYYCSIGDFESQMLRFNNEKNLQKIILDICSGVIRLADLKAEAWKNGTNFKKKAQEECDLFIKEVLAK